MTTANTTPGFNGEYPDPLTGHYLLGNGYRAFNPVLMRFNSPDSLSPFGEGGINAYVYCGGNPTNRADPTGHMWKKLVNMFQSPQSQIDNAVTFTIGADAGIVGTAYQSMTRHPSPVSPVPASRQALDQALGAQERMTPFGKRLAAVNENLASHGNDNLLPEQAAHYASLAKKVASGEISNTTAHISSSLKWLTQIWTSQYPRASMTGFVFNAAAAMTTAGAEAGARKTGAALTGGLRSSGPPPVSTIRRS